MEKQELRKQIKRLIGENAANLEKWSEELCAKIINSEQFQNAPVILAFEPLPDEPDIRPVIQAALNANKKVFLPKIRPNSSFMDFYPFTKETKVEPGSFGILEPQANESPLSLSDFYTTLVLVPGRAFCVNGARLGRGKGFYDRYFQNKSVKTILAGVCFPCQIVESIPSTGTDVPMDIIF
jgi:5,10-methenyltetrahydrofolate synthetase